MTCIVGFICGDDVYIGGDSNGVGGYNLSDRKDKKVFKTDDFVFGFTSSYRMGQIIQYCFTPPKVHPDTELHKYMVAEFMPALRKVLSEQGYLKKENNVERGGVFLVGIKGRLFQIESDLQVGEVAKKYDAVGCGYAYALGALYVLENSKKSVEEKIKISINAAAEFSVVGGRIDIVKG